MLSNIEVLDDLTVRPNLQPRTIHQNPHGIPLALVPHVDLQRSDNRKNGAHRLRLGHGVPVLENVDLHAAIQWRPVLWRVNVDPRIRPTLNEKLATEIEILVTA